MANTVIPQGDGHPELTFSFDPAVLACCPFFLGKSAGQVAAEACNHGDPVAIDSLLTAGLVGGGMGWSQARGIIHSMRHGPDTSSMDGLVQMVVANALA